MPITKDAAIHVLRMNYTSAYNAYQRCVKALTEAALHGPRTSPELLEREANALWDLAEARREFMAGLSGVPPRESEPGT